jgi:fumarylacetoacetate (FAA) hydrolase
MKLGTLKDGSRDGQLVVVSRDLRHAVPAGNIAPTLQAALDDWDYCSPQLGSLYEDINRNPSGPRVFEPDFAQFAAPLPRAYQWLDGSAYLAHVELVRKARGATMPPEFKKDPLMYQGDSDYFIGPRDAIEALSEDWGIDLEAEVAVVVDDVPMGTPSDKASEHVRLLMLLNDVSMRNLIPAELGKGFGFINGKGATAFAPVAVTPDELGEAWDGKRVRRALAIYVNEQPFGTPDCGTDMQFGFHKLITHAARTRPLGAGTVIGSGTISNYGYKCGHACIAELRALETVEKGQPETPFLKFGDRVKIDMLDANGASVFGAIEQQVALYTKPAK